MLVVNTNHMHCYLMLINEKSVTLYPTLYGQRCKEDWNYQRMKTKFHSGSVRLSVPWWQIKLNTNICSRKKKWNLILLCQDHLNQLQFKWISMHVQSNDEWSFQAVVGLSVLCWCCFFSLCIFSFEYFYFDEPIKIDLFPTNEHAAAHECQIRFIIVRVFFFCSEHTTNKALQIWCDDRIIWDKSKNQLNFFAFIRI